MQSRHHIEEEEGNTETNRPKEKEKTKATTTNKFKGLLLVVEEDPVSVAMSASHEAEATADCSEPGEPLPEPESVAFGDESVEVEDFRLHKNIPKCINQYFVIIEFKDN